MIKINDKDKIKIQKIKKHAHSIYNSFLPFNFSNPKLSSILIYLFRASLQYPLLI